MWFGRSQNRWVLCSSDETAHLDVTDAMVYSNEGLAPQLGHSSRYHRTNVERRSHPGPCVHEDGSAHVGVSKNSFDIKRHAFVA